MIGTIITYNNSTDVILKVGNRHILCDGVYEAAQYAITHGINLKYHINDQPKAE